MSLPAAYRLYLPKEWATDCTRRRKAGVPKEITFKTKPAIALEQLRWAGVAGLPRGVVLMDAGYGAYTDLRTNITALGLSYVAGIMPQTSVWARPALGCSRQKRPGQAAGDLQSCCGASVPPNWLAHRTRLSGTREAPTKYWFSTLPANIAFHQLRRSDRWQGSSPEPWHRALHRCGCADCVVAAARHRSHPARHRAPRTTNLPARSPGASQ